MVNAVIVYSVRIRISYDVSSRLHAGQRRGGRGFQDAADDNAIREHVEIILAAFAGWADC